MNKEELYKLALSDVSKYSLLNEIFAIWDKRVDKLDYCIAVNGFISLDVLNKYINVINNWNELKELIEKDLKMINSYLIKNDGNIDFLQGKEANALDILSKMQEIEGRK